MAITIVDACAASSQEWDSIWGGCNYATYFHSREWSEIWQIYTQGKLSPKPQLIKFSDGKQAILPLSEQKRFGGLLKQYTSSPAGTFGGWISIDSLTIEHVNQLVAFLTCRFNDLVWRINPFSELSSDINLNTIKAEVDTTQVLDLTQGFNAVYKRWTKGHISAARKASKSGVCIKVASSLDEWMIYYQIYEDSLRRWGDRASSRYYWMLFEEMFQRHSSSIKLWLATYQGNLIAGALCFYAKSHVVYWHGAGLEEYFHLRPVNLLMYEAIRAACQQDFQWFDFNPSGRHQGVEAFKKSFGTLSLSCPLVTVESPWSQLVRSVQHRTRRQIN